MLSAATKDLRKTRPENAKTHAPMDLEKIPQQFVRPHVQLGMQIQYQRFASKRALQTQEKTKRLGKSASCPAPKLDVAKFAIQPLISQFALNANPLISYLSPGAAMRSALMIRMPKISKRENAFPLARLEFIRKIQQKFAKRPVQLALETIQQEDARLNA